MALDAAGEHEAAARAYALARRPPERGRLLVRRLRGRRRGQLPRDRGRETNFCAYRRRRRLAPLPGHRRRRVPRPDVARRARGDRVRARNSSGPAAQIGWKREADGTPVDDALLTGCSSVYQALRCALAIAEEREEPQPDWELAAGALGHAIRSHPERFLDKSRYSMDWYYPVLGGAMPGAQARRGSRRAGTASSSPDLGVRCVLPNPWVTGGESCELALALWVMGESGPGAGDAPVRSGTCAPSGGMYWTGYVFEGDAGLLAGGAHHAGPAALAAAGGRRARRGRGDHRRLRRGTPAARARPDCCDCGRAEAASGWRRQPRRMRARQGVADEQVHHGRPDRSRRRHGPMPR